MLRYFFEKTRGVFFFFFVAILVLPVEVHAAGCKTEAAALLPKEGKSEAVWLASSKASDQIKAKIVVTKRRRHGAYMDVEFRVEFTNVPRNKFYYLCFWNSEMKAKGAKPLCFEDAAVPVNPNGLFRIECEAPDASKGQWAQFTIRSVDKKIEKTVRFTPFE